MHVVTKDMVNSLSGVKILHVVTKNTKNGCSGVKILHVVTKDTKNCPRQEMQARLMVNTHDGVNIVYIYIYIHIYIHMTD